MDKRILKLREELNELDEKILKLLEERMEIVRDVGQIKSELHIPIEDKEREKEIIDRLSEHAGKGLTENQLIRIFKAVFKSSKQEQRKLH